MEKGSKERKLLEQDERCPMLEENAFAVRPELLLRA
jgi:hypothetical protein